MLSTVDFTPIRGIVGGCLIGLTAAVLLLFNGTVFGCSGIASSVVVNPSSVLGSDSSWKMVFLASFFLASSALASWSSPPVTDDPRLYSDPSIPIPSTAAYLLGGFLVSFGASLGSGCTTGHGVCGMARLSKRSFVAVATFMASAIATAMFTSSLNRATISESQTTSTLFRLSTAGPVFDPPAAPWVGWLISVAFLVAAIVSVPRCGDNRSSADESSPLVRDSGRPTAGGTETEAAAEGLLKSRAKFLPAAVAGILFSVGLAVSGMDLQSKNVGFLDLSKISQGLWDPTLILVMMSAVVVSFVSYQFVPGFGVVPGVKTLDCPVVGTTFDVPNRTVIDAKLVGGAVCFGMGWGLTGLCPGPAWLQAAAGNKAVVFLYVPAYLLGIVSADRVRRRLDNVPSPAASALPK